MLFWLDFRGIGPDWRVEHSALRALAGKLATRTSFLDTVPVE
jgi:hypothetical protein